MKRVKKIVLYAVIVIAVVGIGIVAKNKLSSSKKETTTTATVTKTSVEVQTVTSKEKTLGDTYKSTLAAYQQGIITSKTSAKVVSVSIENGQYVNAGDTIATLDDQDIQNNIRSAQSQIQIYEKQVEAAQQQLNSAQVSMQTLKINVDDAQRNYDRQKALFDGKAISQTDFESYEKTLNTAKASYNSGEASIETAKASIETSKASLEAQKVTLANYQDNLKNTIITAPISGVISDKSLDIGQMASQGSTFAKINDISSIYATIQVPQEKINSVKMGQEATVTIDGSDRTYSGTVQNIDLSADTTSRVFNVKVKIDNSDKSLLPGIFAKVELASTETTKIITVPINTLVGNEGSYSVFINNNGTAKKQQVTIGETDENNVEIVSGLQDGDEVICTNISTLQDGNNIDAVYKQDNDTKDTVSEQDGDTKEAVSE
jgi:multidrug efflux pump subunit AcrA (membrane-fusion protein)